MTYLITYESIVPNYLIDKKIKSFAMWAKLMDNTWLVKSDADKVGVFNYILSGVFFTGKIIVIQVTNEWISKNLTSEVVQWMQGGL